MSGLLIIEDNPVRSDMPMLLRNVSCPLYCEHDLQMVFQPTLMYSQAVGASAFPLVQKHMGDKFR